MRLPLLSLAAGLLLAGCAAVTPVPTTVETPGMPNPENALKRSIQHVDAEMAELGQLRPEVASVPAPTLPGNLLRVVSFQWNGPLDKGVAKLAQSVGYTFYTSGPPNEAPLDVAIELLKVPAWRVFQALGEAAGSRATVEVDPLHHQVQVIHHV